MKAAAMASVTLNGEPRDVPADLSVDRLLRHLDLEPRLVIVELNREILRRDAYASAPVSDGDSLELVHFVGGG
jgi:thiamine biosynthesis protein ThiS